MKNLLTKLICILSLFYSNFLIAQAGEVLSIQTITHSDVDIQAGQVAFGIGTTSIGDLDGDGNEDLAVGAYIGPSTNNGGVYILFLNSNGTLKDTTRISFGESGFNGQTGPAGRFGSALANLGDLDGDGAVELVVGNPYKDISGLDEGAIWILSLNQDGTVKSYIEITEGKSGFTGSLDNNERFGSSLAVMPDIDNDGVPELLVGANNKDLINNGSGRVYLLKLNSNGTVKSYLTYDNNSPIISGSLGGGFRFGQSLGVIQDLDKNGIPEIAVGVRGDDIAFTNHGSIWLLFLDPQLNITSISKLHAKSPNFATLQDSVTEIGWSIATPGDIDGDGSDDLIIGSLEGSIYSDSTNLIRVLFLDSSGGIKSSSVIKSATGNNVFSGFNNPDVDFSGRYISALNDINGDGKRDLIAGSPAANSSNGQIHLLTLDGVSRISLNEETINKNQISIFPNPNSGSIQLSFSDELLKKEFRMILLDAVGRKVLDKEFQTFNSPPLELELNQRPGIYYLRIQGEGYEYTDKIIIQN